MKTLVLLIGLAAGSLAGVADDLPPTPTTSTPAVVTTQPTPAAPAQRKPAFTLKPVGIVGDVEKLTASGTDPEVVKTFVQSWSTPYTIGANDILHLHDMGVPSEVLTTLIRRGAELSGQTSAVLTAPTQSEPSAAPNNNPPAMVYPYPESPAPSYLGPNYIEPNYVSSYPQYVPYYIPTYSYSYGYNYWPYLYSWSYWPSYGFHRHYPYYHSGYYRSPYYHNRGYYHPSYPAHHFSPGRPAYQGRSFGGHSLAAGHGFPQRQGFAGSASFSGRQYSRPAAPGSFAGRGGSPMARGGSFSGARGGSFGGRGGGGGSRH